MSVAPHAGVVDFGTFTPPTASLNGIQGEVPQPLIGQENYVLTGNGWSSLGALGALTYQGTWNASTNTPTLVSSVGVQGYYYVVSVAGNTDLNGTTTWDVGDWAIFNGSAWQKIEGGTVGTFTNVITPQVTARTDNLTLSAISTGTVTINTASANNTFLLVKDDTTAAASTTGLTVLGASSGLGRLALRSNKALYVASGSSNNISFLTNSGVVSEGSTQMLVGHTASAVNYVQVTGATTSNRPRVSFEGSDGNIGGLYVAKGSGGHSFCSDSNASVVQFAISRIASAVNFLQVQGASTGNQPFLTSQGNDTNVALGFASKGNGNLNFYTNSGSTLQFQVWDRPSADIYVAARGGVGAVTRSSIGAAGTGASGFNIYNSQGQAIRFQTNGEGNSEQFAITHTGTSVNYVQVTGSATLARPVISTQGSDSNIGLDINAKGTSDVTLRSGTSATFQAIMNTGGDSWLAANRMTGNANLTATSASASNVAISLQTKGTGAIDLAAGSSGVNISNGGTVTAVTTATRGNGYTALPSVDISAPTTAGGVQAVATALLNLNSLTLVSGGTGYTALNILTVSEITGGTVTVRVDTVAAGVISTFTVTNFGSGTVSAIPANPVSVTGGTGSGATFNANWNCGNITVGTAGSGYVEQPTVTITGGASNGTAYATVGGVPKIQTLGSSLSFFTPGGETMRLIDPASGTVNRYLEVRGGISGSSGVRLGVTNEAMDYYTTGGYAHYFSTNGARSATQFAVNHIASSVNFLQATGSVTGSATGVILSSQGSDTNVPMQIQGKGTGSVAVLTPTTLGGTTGNTAELFAAKGSNSNSIWLRASQYRNATGTDWQTASLRLGMRIDSTDMSYIEFSPSGFAQGLAFQTANSQPINFKTSGGEQLRVANVSSAVNYHGMSGNATGKALQYFAAGSDTNISMAIQPKGTGAINLATVSGGINISNGGTVTGIIRTATGSGYSSAPTVTIAPPTTVGGVQATAQVSGYGTTAGTVVSGGTGYTVGNVITVNAGGSGGIYTVTAVSSGVVTAIATTGNGGTYPTIPTNPVATTGGTGTGLTLNLSNFYVVGFSILTAGSGYIEQPAVTVTGGGAGVNAAAYVNVGSTPYIKSLHTNMNFYTANAGIGFQVYDSGSTGTNYWSAQAGNLVPYLYAKGSTNTEGRFSSNGTSQLSFWTNGGGQQQFVVSHTASAVNYVQATGGPTSGQPVLSVQGSDTNIGFKFRTKGVFNHEFQNGNSNNGFVINLTSGTVLANYIEVAPKITGTSPTISVLGTDTNISLNLVTKGTGTVQQNGNPLAQVNHKYHAFTVGAYYFDSYEQNNYFRLFTQNAAADTIRYGAVNTPEYYDYGTSTWTAWAAGLTGIQNLLDGNPNTGMDVAHANRTFRFVVTNSDGWPTNALVLLQTTWAAITYTTATVTIASGTAVGGPFTTRQVMTFSPANSGNTWGMHAFYTGSIHTGNGFYEITIDITDWVDSGTYVAYPLRNINIFSNYSTVAGRMVPYSNSYDKTTAFIGGIRTPADVNGTLEVGRYSSANPTAIIDTGNNANLIQFRTQYLPQLSVAHTSSVVNYVQVTGATTGNSPTISTQGSDANAGLVVQSKGTSPLYLVTTGSTDVRIQPNNLRSLSVQSVASAVNYGIWKNSATTFSPELSVAGTDTNIDLALTPKGTGNVRYGTHTATADVAITGYIEIKDSSGTIRKLAVIT